MNNYSLLERLFHNFALSSQLIREASFDLESAFISSKSSNENHIFITGLARSGTTILLNSIYKSNVFASLTYADMPFVLAPNLWSKISFHKGDSTFQERFHGDGIKFSLKSPEAFEEVFWKTFDESDSESIDKFKMFINNIISKYKKKRYLSKNNQNFRRVDLISDRFPNAKILIPFRHPIQHAYSLLTQHKKFIQYSKEDPFFSEYMNLIGHTEFGPKYNQIYKNGLIFKNSFEINHWLEQWYLIYNSFLETLINKQNVIFISYEKLCTSKDYWFKILKLLDIKKRYEFKFKESRKRINLKIDNELNNNVLSIYSELSQLI